MNYRSALKAISWEGLSNIACLGLAYLIFGNIGECLVFIIACVLLKTIGYYWHERWWEKQ